MSWLDKYFTKGVTAIQAGGIAVPAEPTINFVGATLVDDPSNGRTTITLSSGTYVAPTGSGIPHIVGGVQQTAASLIVDADVSASAALAVAKLAPAGTNGFVLTTTAGVSGWAAASGGGTVPTGSGIPHIVGGAYSAASSLIVDADVSASAAVAVAKLAPGANTQVLTTTAGVTVWAAAPGGGTTPTGTGFTHITAGAQDAASKKVDLTAAADVTVPATAGGVVTSSGTALQQAVDVFAGADYVSVGPIASQPTAGFFRANTTSPTVGTKILVARYNNTTDYPLISVSAGMRLHIGANESGSGAFPGGTDLYMAAGTPMRVVANGATVPMAATSTDVGFGVPILGGGTSADASPYGVHGKVIDATAGTFTLTAASYKYDAIQLTGGLAGTVTFPASTDATAYSKTIINTSGVIKTLSNGGATTLAIASGNVGRVMFDTAGAHYVSNTVAWL